MTVLAALGVLAACSSTSTSGSTVSSSPEQAAALQRASVSLGTVVPPSGVVDCNPSSHGPTLLRCWNAKSGSTKVAPVIIQDLAAQGLGKTKGLCKSLVVPKGMTCVYVGRYGSSVLHVRVAPDLAPDTGTRISLSLIGDPIEGLFGDPAGWPMVVV